MIMSAPIYNPALTGRVLFEKENEMNNDYQKKVFRQEEEYDWKQTDMSSLIPGPDAVVKYVRYQEERIRQLDLEAKQREAVIHSQDVAMNQMLSSNVAISRRLDYHMLGNVLLTSMLTFFAGVYFW